MFFLNNMFGHSGQNSYTYKNDRTCSGMGYFKVVMHNICINTTDQKTIAYFLPLYLLFGWRADE